MLTLYFLNSPFPEWTLRSTLSAVLLRGQWKFEKRVKVAYQIPNLYYWMTYSASALQVTKLSLFLT